MNDIENARICRAIITIFAEKDLYGGLDILCDLVGWGSFRCESGLYPAKAMNEWLQKMTPNVHQPVEVPSEVARTKIYTRCKACGRQRVPSKGLRHSPNACPECGRGYRKRRIKEDV